MGQSARVLVHHLPGYFLPPYFESGKSPGDEVQLAEQNNELKACLASKWCRVDKACSLHTYWASNNLVEGNWKLKCAGPLGKWISIFFLPCCFVETYPVQVLKVKQFKHFICPQAQYITRMIAPYNIIMTPHCWKNVLGLFIFSV